MKLSKADLFKLDQSYAYLVQILRDIKTRDLNTKQIAENENSDFRADYSGRGMYGSTCAAIVTKEHHKIIERAAQLGILNAKVDNMGMESVVYWPKLKAKEYNGNKA